MPNRKTQKSIDSFAVPVDKVEKITGLDFLDKLPDPIEDKLESSIDKEKWSWSSKRAKVPVKTYTDAGKKRVTAGSGKYAASSRSKKFHKADCRNVQDIKPTNLIRFKSKDKAAKGREPAKCCRP